MDDEYSSLKTKANMVNLLERVSDLVIKGWEYGVVRPLAGLVRKASEKHKCETLGQKKEMMKDGLLQASLSFLSVMGKPLETHKPGEPAYKATVKFYKWLAREGLILPMARMWLAASQLGPHLSNAIERKLHEAMSFNASCIICHAVLLDLQHLKLVTMPGM